MSFLLTLLVLIGIIDLGLLGVLLAALVVALNRLGAAANVPTGDRTGLSERTRLPFS